MDSYRVSDKPFAVALATAKDHIKEPHVFGGFKGILEVAATGEQVSPISIRTEVIRRLSASQENRNAPRGEKGPTDVIGNAVTIARIATSEEEDESAPITSAAAQLGKLGGTARAETMTPQRKAEIAKNAAANG
jgi:hypothetical protein